MSQDASVDAVVLLPGTGNTVENTALFSDLSQALSTANIPVIATRGVGVRADDSREMASIVANVGRETVESRVAEVLAALEERMSALPEGETLSIVVVGHSRGGVAARELCEEAQKRFGDKLLVKELHEIDAVPGPIAPEGFRERETYPENIRQIHSYRMTDESRPGFNVAQELRAASSHTRIHTHIVPSTHSGAIKNQEPLTSSENLAQASIENLFKSVMYHRVLAAAGDGAEHQAMIESLEEAIEQRGPEQAARLVQANAEMAVAADAQRRRDFAGEAVVSTDGILQPAETLRSSEQNAYLAAQGYPVPPRSPSWLERAVDRATGFFSGLSFNQSSAAQESSVEGSSSDPGSDHGELEGFSVVPLPSSLPSAEPPEPVEQPVQTRSVDIGHEDPFGTVVDTAPSDQKGLVWQALEKVAEAAKSSFQK